MISKNKTIVRVEPGKQDLYITREIDAPCELVYKAFTDPDLFVQWLGPRGYETRLETFEPVSGGRYRYVQTGPDGNEFAFHGVFHEVSSENMIQTFEYEGLPETGHVALDSMKLESLPGGRTRITVHSVYQSIEDRDGMVEAGMEIGVREGYERLDEVVEKLMQQQ